MQCLLPDSYCFLLFGWLTELRCHPLLPAASQLLILHCIRMCSSGCKIDMSRHITDIDVAFSAVHCAINSLIFFLHQAIQLQTTDPTHTCARCKQPCLYMPQAELISHQQPQARLVTAGLGFLMSSYDDQCLHLISGMLRLSLWLRYMRAWNA